MTKLLVISDSSSLIIGTKAGLLDALAREFRVEIPQSVFEETVIAGKKLQKVDALKIEEAVNGKLITVRKAGGCTDKKTAKMLDEFNLDRGERDAIQLYIRRNAKLLLVDDRQAINAAKLLGITWTTVPEIIVGFAEKRKISRGNALDALRIAQDEGRYKLDFILEAFMKVEKIKGGGKNGD
ncbi:MAG: hypothetical protein ABH854_05745 [Candidatus Diapherotrites archaeon]